MELLEIEKLTDGTIIRARLGEVRAEIDRLAKVDGDLDAEQAKRWNVLTDECDALLHRSKILKRASDLGDLRTGAGITTVAGDGSDGEHHLGGGAVRADFNVGRVTYSDPWDYQRSATPGPVEDMRGRALAAATRAAFTTDDTKSIVTEAIEDAGRIDDAGQAVDPQGLMYRWACASSSPDYARAWTKFIRDPQHGHLDFTPSERAAFSDARNISRAMGEGSIGAGQAMVPQFLDPSVVITNSGVYNPLRAAATVKRIATQTWTGVTSAGITANWVSEATEVSDDSPTLAQPTITPVRGQAYAQASFELIDDTNIAAELVPLFNDARERLQATAFSVGTGSTQPFGIVTELGLTTASRVSAQTNGSYGAIDVYRVDNALGARWNANSKWLADKSIYNLTRQFAASSSPLASSFWTDFEGDVPAKLIGHPTMIASGMKADPLSTATASNDDIMVLGDFRQYYIVDHVASHLVYNPIVLGSNRRPTGESGWYLFFRTGARTVNADAFRMLRV